MTKKNNEENLNQEPLHSDLSDSLDEMDKLVDDLTHEADDIEELVGAADEIAHNEHSLSQTPLEIAELKVEEHHNNLLRLAAEMDNLRKRTAREVEQARKFAVERFAKEVLMVKDSLEMGMQESTKENTSIVALREGMEITMKQVDSVFEKFAIKQIDAAGQPFNPELHEAMAMQPSAEMEPNTVIFVMQQGYTINERVLRPARVMVSKELDPEDG